MPDLQKSLARHQVNRMDLPFDLKNFSKLPFFASLEKFLRKLVQTLTDPFDEDWPENRRTLRDAVNF